MSDRPMPFAGRSVFFDRQGQPIADLVAWGKLSEDPQYFRVALDVVGDLEVSTVWIGIDVTFGYGERSGPPVIFETLVFDDAGDERVRFGQRYCTEAEALAGHAVVLEWARSEARVFDALGGIVAAAIAQQRLST